MSERVKGCNARDGTMRTLEGTTETVKLCSKHVEVLRQLGRTVGIEAQRAVHRGGDLQHELLADAVLEQLLGVDLDHTDECALHGEDALGEDRDGVRGTRQLVALLELRVLLQALLLDARRELVELVGLDLDDLVEDHEHAARNDAQHVAHEAHQLACRCVQTRV